MSTLDAAFLEKMFEHLRAWKETLEEESVGANIHEGLESAKTNEQDKDTKLIDKQLETLEPKIAHYDRLVTKGFGLDDATLEEYGKELARLRKLKSSLEAAKKEIEAENAEKAESQQLLNDTLEERNKFSLKNKRRVVKLVVDYAAISRIAPSWLKVEIVWKRISLPSADTGIYGSQEQQIKIGQRKKKQYLKRFTHMGK